MMRKLVAVLLVTGLANIGCYNTYNVSMDEMAKLQEGGQSSAVKVATNEGTDVVVTENTKIGVTMEGGRYVAISPFNFTLAGGQLVAPDEDRLLSAAQIQTGNVKEVSGTKTALLVAGAVAVLVGVGLAITLTAEDRKGFGE